MSATTPIASICDQRRRAWLATAAAITSVAVTSGALVGCKQDRESFQSTDVTGADFGKDFQLQDSDGRTYRLADFRGRAVLLFFGFTQCPDFCPTTLARAAQTMKLLGPDAARLQVIFVSVDPERDTPELLREFTQAFDPTFLALHGDLATTERTAKDFKIFYRKVPTAGSYTIDHTTTSYAYDPQGRLRLAINESQPEAALAADLRVLLQGG